jgi:hypothetical protein
MLVQYDDDDDDTVVVVVVVVVVAVLDRPVHPSQIGMMNSARCVI